MFSKAWQAEPGRRYRHSGIPSIEARVSRLAATESERRAVAQSALFKEAQMRLLELQRREAAEFARVVRQAESLGPQGMGLVKLEGEPSVRG